MREESASRNGTRIFCFAYPPGSMPIFQFYGARVTLSRQTTIQNSCRVRVTSSVSWNCSWRCSICWRDRRIHPPCFITTWLQGVLRSILVSICLIFTLFVAFSKSFVRVGLRSRSRIYLNHHCADLIRWVSQGTWLISAKIDCVPSEICGIYAALQTHSTWSKPYFNERRSRTSKTTILSLQKG